jgi:hypothetical protein
MKQLLIEHISNIEVPKSTLIESMNGNDGRLILRNVLLQRADTPNRNKRIYSRSILDKALNEYFEKIREKKAFSELDHPTCFWENTEILTKNGWKYIKDTIETDLVATLNPSSGNMEWQYPSAITNQYYSGSMFNIHGKNINTTVTGNHKFHIRIPSGNLVTYTAQELYSASQNNKSINGYIPITSTWNGIDHDVWEIDGTSDYLGTTENRKIQYSNLVLDSKSFFAFLGFYLAEGCVRNTKNRGNYEILISQNEGARAEQFRVVLSNMSPGIKWTERKRKNNIIFSIVDKRLYDYLKPLGNKYTKFIPEDIKSASSSLLSVLFEWFMKGDGSDVHTGYSRRKSVFTVSKKLIEDLNEILLKIGYAGVIKIQHNNDRKIGERLIKKENTQPLYRLWVKQSKGIYVDFRYLKVEPVNYNGTIHCVTVDNGIIYCRDGNSQFWSGNSDDANVISLKNVCQAIKDAYWKGNEIRGDVEILNTPSGNIVKEILLAGYRVGQSSRGLGSVTPLREGGDDLVEVQDDFEFLTLADCVSDPSTHNADMIIGENYKSSTTQPNKIDSLIRDIICELSNNCCIKL